MNVNRTNKKQKSGPNEEIRKLQPVINSIQLRKDDVIEQIISYFHNVYEGVTVSFESGKFRISGTSEENLTKVKREIKEILKFSSREDEYI